MINHLPEHPHAFLNKDNKVILTAVFDESAHNHQLLEDIRIANGAEKVICCCVFGRGGDEDTWDENTKTWISPVYPVLELPEQFE